MVSSVGLLAYQARTTDPEAASLGLSGVGRWYVLDGLVPDWRKYPNGYLLWTLKEKPSMAIPSAVKFIKANEIEVILAFGLKTAFTLGVPWRTFKWFAGYRTTIREFTPMVIPVPMPSPGNRALNDPAVRKKVVDLFLRLEDPEWVARLTGEMYG